jgi:membrane protease YdiL (CAAX protease family)
MSAGFSVLVTFIVTVIIATLGIVVFRIFIQRAVQRTFGGIIAGVVNSGNCGNAHGSNVKGVIMGFNMVYRRVAKRLTDWENHRTGIVT